MDKGYLILPFTRGLSGVMREHISTYIGAVVGWGDPTEEVLEIHEDDFRHWFSKPFRVFPEHIGLAALGWLTRFSGLLNASQIGVNFVSRSEPSLNPNLSPDTLDVFWRAVRPGKPDVGPPHRDDQFWHNLKGTDREPRLPFDYDERWRIWFPLAGCDATNSLQVIPSSHLEDVPIDTSETVFGWRHPIREDWLAENEHRFVCPFTEFSGSCILFHDKLVHRGPPNNTEQLRLSGEFTVLVKR